jgi:uncharacterized protein (TIGR00297 family)
MQIIEIDWLAFGLVGGVLLGIVLLSRRLLRILEARRDSPGKLAQVIIGILILGTIERFCTAIARDSSHAITMILAGVAISLLLVLFSHHARLLSLSGALAAFPMGCSILGMGGFAWALPLLTFFLSSSILSRIGRSRKAGFDLIFEKGSQRDVGQVLGNGGIAWILIVMHSYAALPELYCAFTGALAAAQADTWATEIGTMARDPRAYSVIGWKRVPPGTSGGVSWLGTIGGIAGALLIWVSAWVANMSSLSLVGLANSIALIGISGGIGSLVDSILGATLQARYLDPVRDKITERPFRQTGSGLTANSLIAGWRWMTNDAVNLLCSFTGAAVALLGTLVLRS